MARDDYYYGDDQPIVDYNLALPTSLPSMPSRSNVFGPASWPSSKLTEAPITDVAPGTFGLPNPLAYSSDKPKLPIDYPANMLSDEELTIRELNKQNAPREWFPAIKEAVGKLRNGFASPTDVYNRLTGSGGQERYQTWPEQLVRSGFSLPGDVASGRVPVRDPLTGQTSEQVIERTQDLSGLMGGGSVAGVGREAMTRAVSDTATNAPISALAKPVFYSALEHAVSNSKMPKADAEQWLGYLRNQPGVKAEELDFVLHDLPKGQISKAELENYVSSHKVELKEVEKGAKSIPQYDIISDTMEDGTHNLKIKSNSGKIYEADKEKGSGHYQVLEMRQDKPEIVAANLNVHSGSRPETFAEIRDLIRAHEHGDNTTGEISAGPKYSQWQLPGGENYREMLLTLPEKTPEQIGKEYYNSMPSNTVAWENLPKNTQETFMRLGPQKQAIFQSSHWSEPNVLAHIRTNERFIPTNDAQSTANINKSDFKGYSSYEYGEGVLGGPAIYGVKPNGEKVVVRQNISNSAEAKAEVDRLNANVAIPTKGLNSLHIEEIQSDWHQKGRKEGYRLTDTEKKEFEKIDRKLVDSKDESILGNPEPTDAIKMAVGKGILNETEGRKWLAGYKSADDPNAIPNAPFKQSWPDLALKRVIAQAAREGKDAISWTPGEAQALRYQNEIRQRLKTIEWSSDKHFAKYRPDARTDLKRISVDGETGKTWMDIDDKGKIVHAQSKELQGKTLDDAIGKDLANQIMEKGHGTIDAKNYVMGAGPMKAFYDKMLVDKANAIAKKFGGKVEDSNLPSRMDQRELADLRDVTAPDQIAQDKIKKEWDELVTEGQKLNKELDQLRGNSGPNAQATRARRNQIDDRLDELHKQAVDETMERVLAKQKGDPIHVLRITPQLRDAALNKGFSLFTDTGKAGAPLAALSRVEHNPFTLGEMEKQHGVKLEPVAHNPFTTDAYHGTSGFRGTNIEEYRPDMTEFYSTPNPKLAGDYARFGSGSILPLKLNTSNYHVYDAKGETWHSANAFAIRDANQLDKPGVVIKNVVDNNGPDRGPQTVYITLDPSTVRSKFAKFDPAKFKESGLLKAAGVPFDISNQDGKDPLIDNTHDVPYGAGASKNGLVVHIDKSIPEHDAKTGDLDLHKPLALHERTEKALMETGMPYTHAHSIATKAEKGLVDALGGDWKEYSKVMDGYLKETEHENPKNPPNDLYLKPYPHDKQVLLEKHMTHSGEDINDMSTAKTAVAIGAAKAAEWLAFLGSRNYPKINGPLTAAWIAQWPMMQRMLKEDINRQLKEGKKPSEVTFEPGSIGDAFGAISALNKRFGNKTLVPHESDPFK